MDNRQVGQLCLIGVVLLAGCNSSLFGPNYTPKTTTNSAPTGQLAPGLSARGLTDVSALVDTHSQMLQEDSYTMKGHSSERYGNGTMKQSFRGEVQWGPNGTRYYYRVQFPLQPTGFANFSLSQRKMYANQDKFYVANIGKDKTTYNILNRSRAPVPQGFTELSSLRSILHAFNKTDGFSIHKLSSASGPPRYRFHLTKLESSTPFTNYYDLDTVRNASFTGVVDGWGVIHRWHVTYTGQAGNYTITGNRTTRFTAIGKTNVSQPDWIHNATNNQTTIGEQHSKA